MKAKQVGSLFDRYWRTELPGLRHRGSLLYQRPVGDILRACHFESSGFEGDRFAVTAFIQPLYQPFPSLVLTWGMRLGARTERWFDLLREPEAAAAAEILQLIRTQALPFFARFREPADFVEHAPASGWNREDPYFLEGMAYSLVLCGEYPRARSYLGRLLDRLGSEPELLPYQRAMMERNQQFDAKVRDRAAEAVEELRNWRGHMLGVLGLADDAAVPPAS